MPDDRELLAQYTQNGSREALDELARRYRDLVFSAALRQVHQHAMAEDVTQAVFLILARKACGIRRSASLGGWLLTVTRHAAVLALMKQRRNNTHERIAARPELSDAVTEDWESISSILDAALAALPPRDRDAVVLRFFQDKSYTQIAMELSLTPEAARKRVARALQRLRRRLGRRGMVVASILLAALLRGHGVQAAPAAGAASSAGAADLAKGVLNMMAWMNMRLAGVVAAMLIAGAAALVAVESLREATRIESPAALRDEVAGAPDGMIASGDGVVMENTDGVGGGEPMMAIGATPFVVLDDSGSVSSRTGGEGVLLASWQPGQQAPVVFPSSGIMVAQSEYSQLISKVNQSAEAVFSGPEGRAAHGVELLAGLDKLVPIVESKIKMPASQALKEDLVDDPMFQRAYAANPALLKQMDTPAATEGFRHILRQQLSEYQLFRLALDEPGALRTYQEAVQKGGTAGAAAAVDRAAADWLMAGRDSTEQSKAFETYRAAAKGPGQTVSWQLWSNLLNLNPPASAAIGTPLLAFLKPYCTGLEGQRMWNHFRVPVVRMELEGKPLTMSGTLVSGGTLTTTAWKGKVVLIVGWAACFAKHAEALQAMQELLVKHQREGLEVVGLSYGPTRREAKTVLAGIPGVRFPQIFDGSHPDIAQLCAGTTTFGLAGEVMGPGRVIDRKGNQHFLADPSNAEALETEVLKLLAEAP